MKTSLGHSRHHLGSGMHARFMKLCRKEGRNSYVTQDHIGVCHMPTNMNKKASEHMNFRAHTRNEVISTDNITGLFDSVTAVLRSPRHIEGLGGCAT